jgi:anti-anti-sigma factor
MNITQREENGITTFTLEGRIDSAGAVELDSALRQAVLAGHYKMVLDMANVQYINSAGLRTLADILTQNRGRGGDVRLVALHPKVERVFKIIGFDKFFEIYDTVSAAAADF